MQEIESLRSQVRFLENQVMALSQVQVNHNNSKFSDLERGISDLKKSVDELDKKAESKIKALSDEIETSVDDKILSESKESKQEISAIKDEIAAEEERDKAEMEVVMNQIKSLSDKIATLEKKGPLVQKVVERITEVVEQPIVHNNTTEVIREVAMTDDAKTIVEKIESLDGNDQLDYKALKNRPKEYGPPIRSFSSLLDVNMTGVTNGQVPVYDAASGSFKAGAASGGSSGVSGLVANSTAAATANTTAIQTALNNKGLVQITTSGIIYINNTLVSYDNTKLVCNPDVEIKLTGGTVKSLIHTSQYVASQAGMPTVTLTWSSGRSVQVTSTAHGLVKGQYFYLYSSTLVPTQFIGVFPIINIIDANNFTIWLHRTPLVGPTGTAKGIVANQNIYIEGGIYNQDFLFAENSTGANTAGTSLGQIAMRLGVVANPRVRDVQFKNVAKFCVEFGAVYNAAADNIKAETSNSDIIKVYGPATLGKVSGIAGYTGDDIMSFSPRETAAYPTFIWTWGDIQNWLVESNGPSTKGGSICTLYPTTNEYIGGISVKNLSGYGVYRGVGIIAGYANAQVDDVTFDNISPGADYTVGVGAGGFTGMVINRLEIKNFHLMPAQYVAGSGGMLLDAGTTIKEFTLNEMNINDAGWPSGGGQYVVVSNGSIETLNLNGGRFGSGVTNFANVFQINGSLQIANITGITMDGPFNFAGLFTIGASAGTPVFNIQGNNFNNYGPVIGTDAPCTVVLTGNRINVGGNGIIRSNTAVAIAIRSQGNQIIAGSVFTNGGATGIWSLYGFDLLQDIGGTGVAKTNGAYCFNSTARGTIAANRLVTCNGTNWVQVDTPANTF